MEFALSCVTWSCLGKCLMWQKKLFQLLLEGNLENLLLLMLALALALVLGLQLLDVVTHVVDGVVQNGLVSKNGIHCFAKGEVTRLLDCHC